MLHILKIPTFQVILQQRTSKRNTKYKSKQTKWHVINSLIIVSRAQLQKFRREKFS